MLLSWNTGRLFLTSHLCFISSKLFCHNHQSERTDGVLHLQPALRAILALPQLILKKISVTYASVKSALFSGLFLGYLSRLIIAGLRLWSLPPSHKQTKKETYFQIHRQWWHKFSTILSTGDLFLLFKIWIEIYVADRCCAARTTFKIYSLLI